jgi:hypothetical protein
MNLTSALVLAGLTQFASSIVIAAEISIVGQVRSGQSLVLVIGELNAGDDDHFKRELAKIERAAVFLDSPGGSLVAGLGIGTEIRRKGY